MKYTLEQLNKMSPSLMTKKQKRKVRRDFIQTQRERWLNI